MERELRRDVNPWHGKVPKDCKESKKTQHYTLSDAQDMISALVDHLVRVKLDKPKTDDRKAISDEAFQAGMLTVQQKALVSHERERQWGSRCGD